MEITESEQPEFCQGGIILTATSATATSYLWSTGETTASIEVNASGDYSVVATEDNGCEAEATTNVVYDDKSLISEYSIIVNKRLHLTYDNVCGGAGILKPFPTGISQIYGSNHDQFEAKFTVSPWYASHVIKIEPWASQQYNIGRVYDGTSNLTLPAFEVSVATGSSPAINVASGETRVLTGSVYGAVNIAAGGTLVFDNPDVHIYSLTTGYGGSNIEFTNCGAKLHITDKWLAYPDVQFNAAGKAVTVYAGPDSWNLFDRIYLWGGDATVNANIYTKGLFRTTSMGGNNILKMNGQFIANEIYTYGNAEWLCSLACATTDCGFTPKSYNVYEAQEVTEIEIDVFPNPASSQVSFGNVASFQKVQIFDGKGTLVMEVNNTSELAIIQLDVSSLSNGVYTTMFVEENTTQQERLVITK